MTARSPDAHVASGLFWPPLSPEVVVHPLEVQTLKPTTSRPLTVYVTTKDEQEARRLGRLVVERQLAACANIVPTMHAIYEWEGNVVEQPETLMFLKTDAAKLDELTLVLRKHHSYTVPCIVALPIEGGNPEYAAWIAKQVGTSAESR